MSTWDRQLFFLTGVYFDLDCGSVGSKKPEVEITFIRVSQRWNFPSKLHTFVIHNSIVRKYDFIIFLMFSSNQMSLVIPLKWCYPATVYISYA